MGRKPKKNNENEMYTPHAKGDYTEYHENNSMRKEI